MSIAANVPRAPRFALEVPVRLRRVGTDSWECGHTINISRSGLLVVVPGSLECGDTIEAVVRLSEACETVTDVSLKGRVARRLHDGGCAQLATTIDEYRFYSADPLDAAPLENDEPD